MPDTGRAALVVALLLGRCVLAAQLLLLLLGDLHWWTVQSMSMIGT
jgi:hypothetical protein